MIYLIYDFFKLQGITLNHDILKKISQFIFPSITKRFFVRILIVILISYIFFGYICIPIRIKGRSMEPTYKNKGFNFCWTPYTIFSTPQKNDIVLIRLAGKKVMLLKRIVAIHGDMVEFKSGKLYINGIQADEPYVKFPCSWELSPRKIKKNHVYVVGDNRDMPMENHVFGQTSLKRIAGESLW